MNMHTARRRAIQLQEEFAFNSQTGGYIHLRSVRAQEAWVEYRSLLRKVGSTAEEWGVWGVEPTEIEDLVAR